MPGSNLKMERILIAMYAIARVQIIKSIKSLAKDVKYKIRGELRVVQEVADEAFRDDQGVPTDHLGLQLHLSDFAYEDLAQDEIGDHGRELVASAQQLCQYLTAAETKVQQVGSLGKHSMALRVKKRRRSETPPEQIISGDEARYVEQEKRAAKRIADDDRD
ncbi:hypothetical protein K469DRAFT_753181 [Zopfia rhizophila CBS 207.26]|uniref:Uncharacterized protein n=1 Tax=Zopfia rhizophila CBS 207.26 TaxID=1314779 RepID=A0A6A6DMS2_9PEZI|nr:hypothetical protein K469DRAFT_753181 [Zopfia rhizophila CBS 207.26]